VTTDPNHTAFPTLPLLHERLTVVNASADERGRLREALPTESAGAVIDLDPAARVVNAADLTAASRTWQLRRPPAVALAVPYAITVAANLN